MEHVVALFDVTLHL